MSSDTVPTGGAIAAGMPDGFQPTAIGSLIKGDARDPAPVVARCANRIPSAGYPASMPGW